MVVVHPSISKAIIGTQSAEALGDEGIDGFSGNILVQMKTLEPPLPVCCVRKWLFNRCGLYWLYDRSEILYNRRKGSVIYNERS